MARAGVPGPGGAPVTGTVPGGADEAGSWATAPARRLPGDIAARIRAAREAGVEERHLAAILAEASPPFGAGSGGLPLLGRTDRMQEPAPRFPPSCLPVEKDASG